MALLIGTDEAGYGPNLGPLVISATAWRVPDEAIRQDLYGLLGECVAAAPTGGDDGRLAIADSKKLYQSGGDLAALECGVLAVLRVLGIAVERWRELWLALDPASGAAWAEVPWHGDYDHELPCAADPARVADAAKRLAAGMRNAGVRLAALRSRAVFPQRWNDLLDLHGSKGTALSHCTLELIRETLMLAEEGPALVVCDKHGGRNRYGPLLQHFFPEEFVEAHGEGRAASVYRWGPPARRVEVRFMAGGESFLPSALASMASKYLREVAMAAFNDFWRRHMPELRPTAGYPVDARRFRTEIAPLQKALGLTDRQVWRNR